MPTPGLGYINATWKIQDSAGNYFGFATYPRYQDPDPREERHAYGKVVWSVNGVAGERDLYYTSTLLPRLDGEFALDTWYRVQLHTSPDGRFALELYDDAIGKNYIQIKSGDQADSGGDAQGLIPRFPTGHTWSFINQVTDYNPIYNNYSIMNDDYKETGPLYSQSDSVYKDITDPQDQAVPYPTSSPNPLVGTDNNCTGMNIRFVPITEQWSAKYDESASPFSPGSHLPKRSKTLYGYLDDPSNLSSGTRYGNQTSVDQIGDLDVAGYERGSLTYFYPNTAKWIIDKPARNVTYDGAPGTTQIAEWQNFYDTNSRYDLPPTIGDVALHKLQGIENGTSVPTETSIERYGHDTYGNEVSVTDPNTNTTTTGFDTFYHSFPITVTYPMTAAGRSEYTFYDYTHDTITNTVGINGTDTHYTYDVFGRPASDWVDGSGGGDLSHPNEIYSFEDIGQQSLHAPIYISYQKRLNADTSTYGYAYGWQTRWYDGIGRTVEDTSFQKASFLNSISYSDLIVSYNTYTVTNVLSSTSKPYIVTSPSGDPRLDYVQPDTSQPQTIHYYDGAMRPSMVVNTDHSKVIYDYSQLQWVGMLDENGTHQSFQHTDMLGRMDVVQDTKVGTGSPQSKLTTYSYDKRDLLTGVTRDAGSTGGANPVSSSTMTYDGLGRKSQMQDADMGLWKYGYDAAGNVITQSDALYQSNPSQYADHLLFFSYDKMNRVTDKYYGQAHSTNNMPDVVYYYDNTLGDASSAYSWGKLRQVNVVGYGGGVQGSSKSNGHGYLYDFKGRPVSDVVTTTSTYTSRPYITSYSYDVGDRITSMTYPNPGTAEVVTTTYNTQGMGLPASLSSNVPGNPNPVYDTAYNEWGELTSLRQGSAVQSSLLTTQFSYNVRGWLTNTLATTINGTQTVTHLNMVYGYDRNGNVTSLTNTGVTSPSTTTNPTFSNSYTYDWLDRIASGSSTAVGTGGASLFPTESYSYDNLDRMTTRTIGGIQYSYAYTDPSHVDAPTSYRNNSYSYDANGDQLTGTVNGSSQTRTYDQERHLVQITSASTTSTFIYDGNDQRIIQNVTAGLSTTRTLYIGSFYEETLTGGSTPPYIIYYILGSKMVGMRRANQPGGISANGQFRVVGDQLGSTTLIIDTAPTPNVTQREYYKPFGEVAFTSGSSRTDKGFTGQRLDSGSGLMYYGARYYDPALSYFISADPTVPEPSNAMDYNRYLYVRDNPLRYLDSLGYGPEDYYIFVQGCVSSGECNRDSPDDWGEYGAELERQFNEGNWGQGDEIWERQSFKDWAKTHVRYVGAKNLEGGAQGIRDTIASITDRGPGVDINLLGHSMGGGAIAEYMLDAADGVGADSRVKSAVMIDAPLVESINVGPFSQRLFGSRIKNLGAAAAKLGIKAISVDTPNDWVSSPAIHGVLEVANPTYPKGHGLAMPNHANADRTELPFSEAQNTWHDHTSRYMATETQAFLAVAWR